MPLWRRIPAKYEAYVEAAIRRALEDVSRERVPTFAVDENREGTVVVTLGVPEKAPVMAPPRAD